MNNKKTDDPTIDSTLEKQVIRYRGEKPVFGMRFMAYPDTGKLVYSSGIVLLIFSHENYFLDKEIHWHQGDTIVTFNDLLRDMNFGQTWGASHSLIQSATYNNDFFFTASLSDSYPQGILVQHTSKKEFDNEFDKVNKVNNKENIRVNGKNGTLAGKITGTQGYSYGRLGGLLFFEKLGIFCLVYAKAPDPKGVNKYKDVIYVITFTFDKNNTDKTKYSVNKTQALKVFQTDNLVTLRAGKYGDDMLFISYIEIPENEYSV